MNQPIASSNTNSNDDASAADIRNWIVRYLAARAERDVSLVDPTERFQRLGLDSMSAMSMLVQLGLWFGRALSPTLVWEYPTPDALARHLAGAEGESVIAMAARDNPGHDEPVAIIGMACRFPGAPNIEAFWDLLREGRDAITEVPKDRWDVSTFYDENPNGSGKMRTKWGGFLGGVDQFDPQFFGISPREAIQMDPQQRLMLELSWEALEDAGIVPASLKGTDAAVIIGALFNDYMLLQDRLGPQAVTAHTSTGGASCIIANRISYALGLMGPSMTVETACSSALVAVHLACASLRRGETNLAFAGGVNLLLLPETTLGFERLGAMSPNGRCRTFDALANGYVRSEGAGLVLLKRLRDAITDGDRIHGLLRGGAVNNDGASNGLTAPNPAAQRSLIAQACRDAGVDPATVRYVEAHGTGTPLGDPIEASGLGAIYGAARTPDDPLRIGSVKTNIGHLEAAAGIAGLIKAALMVERGMIPPSLHFENPNPLIDFDALRLRVVTALEAWPDDDEPRRAGISSFGYGGTGAHLIVESLPVLPRARAAMDARVETPRNTAWIFSGQGSVWPGMGRDLLVGEPTFRAAIARCDAIMRPEIAFSILDELYEGSSAARLERIDVAWPLLFAFQVALAAWWRSHGLEPSVVLGHSIGEVAAAHVAGALTLEDAAMVICHQAKLVQQTAHNGAMAFVALDWSATEMHIAPYGDRLACAIAASPSGTVISGDTAAIAEVVLSLQQAGTFARTVATTAAVHTSQMDEVRHRLPSLIPEIRPRKAVIPLVSSKTGQCIDGENLNVRYWSDQLRAPVHFMQAVNCILAKNSDLLFLELSPHPIVQTSIEQCIRHRHGVAHRVIGSLVRGEPASRSLGAAMDELVRQGAKLAVEEQRRAATRSHVVLLSAKTSESLFALAQSYHQWIARADATLEDIAYSASLRRSHFSHRLAVVGCTKEEIAEALGAFAAGEIHSSIVTGKVAEPAPKVVFVFPGQGSQWVGMGRQLSREEPVFRGVLATCDKAIRKEAGFSIIEELDKLEETSRLSEIDIVQPVLFAIEVALAGLWRAWGVEPSVVIGHSMGEVAAAFVAGALSMEDAAAIICRRSRLLRTVRGQGAMALVELTLADAEKALAGYESRLSVAVSNGPRSTVIAGDPAALEAVLGKLEKEGVFCRRVKVDVASHSPQMDRLREELLESLAGISPQRAAIPMRSTVTCELVRGAELSPMYWADNLCRPVLFSRVVDQCISDQHTIFVEMSPHPILVPSVEENLQAANIAGLAIGSTRREQDERQTMLSSLGALHARGVSIAWKAFFPDGGRLITLPTYPWHKQRYWIDATSQGKARGTPTLHTSDHALLGVSVSPSTHSDERIWQQSLSVAAVPWLAEHRVQEHIVFPGAGYVECALEAATASFGAHQVLLEDVAFEQMLVLSENQTRDVQVVLIDEGERCSFRIFSRSNNTAWTLHASGSLQSSADDVGQSIESPRDIAARLPQKVDVTSYYRGIRDRQMYHGPPFQGIVELRSGEHEALAKIRLPEDVLDDGYVMHPALLDACVQLFAAFGALSGDTDTYVPVRISRLHLYQRPGREAWVVVTKSRQAESALDLRIADERGRVFLAIDGLSMQRLDRVAKSADPLAHCVYDVVWREVKPLAHPSFVERGTWLVFVDRAGLGHVLAERLSTLGQRSIRVLPGSSYANVSPNEIRIDFGKPEDYRRMFKETFGEEGHCEGVAFLPSLDATPFDQTTTETLTKDLAHASVSATYLAQAIVQHGFRNAPRLFLITRGAQSVHASDPVSVSQAPILGLGKTMAMEHPELRCVRIDLPAERDEQEVEWLLRQLGSRDREDQISLRGRTRYVARLAHGKLDAADDALRRIREDRTYLITGGLGGLGLSLAQWLVKQGARNLVLAGRSGPSEQALAAIQSMEHAGARVHCAQVDVSCASGVENLFSLIRNEMPPLGGIVHAAMVLDDHTLLEQSQESFERAFAPKALGAWNLHKYSVKIFNVDFFVMYSSATGLIGSPGQANYCASNAYLDALCRERVRLGLPGMSIQWGGFAEVGAAAALDIRGNRLSLRGIMSFSPAEGLDAFQRLLGHPRPEVGVVRFDPRQWVEFYPSAAGIPFFADVMQRDNGRRKAPTGQEMIARLEAARPDERLPMLERHVLDHVSAVLHLDPARIDGTAPLQSLGMDSLMSLELRNRIEASLGLRLSATVLFTHSTVSALSRHLMTLLVFTERPTEPRAAPERASVHAATDHALAIDDIAVVGMACRFPAGGVDPNAFWQALEAGADGIRRIPAERWPAKAIDSDNPATRWAGLLDAVDRFDSEFFGISPREANLMDPQQRLLLEVSWEAMENAGHALDRLGESDVGVFIGIMGADYAQMVREARARDMYGGIGNVHSVAAGRLSYTLGLHGPSMAVDTACSSSLVAVHLACQSLRNHESDLSLAGGVNAILDPQTMVMTAAMQALAPDGRCKTFDAEANGFVRGEGCGIVVLKRLSDAERDGDHILAVIRGSVVNQDGRSTGLTAPNVLSQQAMLRRALKVARIQPEDIGYVETHGTGTPLGDPIEFEALREVLGKTRKDGSACLLGALKTNVGHMEGAAGIGGLIKAILCLQHEAIPKNLHFTTLNPRMSLEGTPFVIPTETMPWKSNGKLRRAGVSSFGISGTNAHVILEEAPRHEEKPFSPASSYVLPLSAKTPEALVALAKSYHEWLTKNDEPLHHVAYTASVRRSHLEHRLSVIGTNTEEVAFALRAFAEGELSPAAVTGKAAKAAPKVVFVFPGQGSQWVGMGRQLYREEPVFRDTLVACDEAIRNEAGFSVIEELHNPEETSRLSNIDVVQPVLLAIEVALAALWRSWGVEPSAVVGHSMGEVAAAFVAGALCIEDAAAIICRRSRLLRTVSGQGAMALVELSLPNAEKALVGYEARLSVAVSNGPQSTVIAGDPAALEAVLGKLDKERVFYRRVKVDVASHSPQMDPLREELLTALVGISPKSATIPMRSTVTGEIVRDGDLSAMYWADNLRRPVLFSRVVEELISDRYTIFVEMSPHPILTPSIEENLQAAKMAGLALGSTRREQDERRTMLSFLGALHTRGVTIDWQRFYPDGGRVVPLPTYPWQKQRYWLESLNAPANREEEETLADAATLRKAGAYTPENAFYQLEWREAPLSDAVLATPGRWIIVARANSEQGSALEKTLPGAILTTPTNLVATLDQHAHTAGLVCLWEVADGPAPNVALRVSTEALAIVQALQRHPHAPHRMIWATTTALAIEPEESASVALSALWGLGRVVMQEAPELGLSLIDIPPGQTILREISANDGENQVVRRGENRLVARLVGAPAKDIQSVSMPNQGTVLVTGGLGALGSLVAKWLATRGVPHLILTGRRGMDTPGAAQAIAEISALGTQVTVATADVADRSALQRVLQSIPSQWPLRGVIHAAAVLDDGVISEQNAERFARVFAPKVIGAWNLHELTKSCDLDFFVLFSSVAGLIGTAGQSNYAAANAFLDGLAAYRRGMGLPAQSLAWGAWAEIGKAAELDASKQIRLTRQGIQWISPEDGMTLFERALGCKDVYLGIVPFDKQRLSHSFGETIPPVWRALVSAPEREAARGHAPDLSPEQGTKEIRAIVHTEVARVLGMSGKISEDKPFRELGLDSLMAVELRNALGRRFNRTLSATLAFDYPTIDALSQWLLEEVLRIDPHRASVVNAVAPMGMDEPIAIVGIGCRFPGGITDTDSFWHLLDGGIDAITEIPRSRWDVDAFYDPNPEAQGKMVTRSGGFIPQIDRFDTAFFGISPREATLMDPQQRLVLETSWEALEHAGIVPERLMESDTGVFIGQNYHEYANLVDRIDVPDGYSLTGAANSVTSGRISYFLGLRGPSLTVDTACSSSLVSVHLACQSLRRGECSTALAGGVTLMLTPVTFVQFSRMRGLALDGRCKSFSAAADGTGWGEGCGMLVLKRLSDARRDGHRILAVIRSSAVNQDGRSNGLTAPNGPSQQALIRSAIAQAGLKPADIGYVECHGTGTTLGDPIEAQALGAVLAEGRAKDKLTIIGSVKSNIGHTQAAAGVAGLIKTVLAMQNGRIPKSLHIDAPSPHIPWSELPLKIATEAVDWPRTGASRIAGVSSFGISGTNAHVILEEAPQPKEKPFHEASSYLLPLSAKTPEALAALAQSYQEWFAHHDERLHDVAYTASLHRSLLEHRLTVTGANQEEIANALGAFAAGEMPPNIVTGKAAQTPPHVVFVFSGQGSQWVGMGRQLYREEPVFRDALVACDQAIHREARVSVIEEINKPGETSRLHETIVAQPALFAMEVALSALMQSWGIVPAAVIGHSVGEIAAAHVAGMLDLAQAARLVAIRARVMQKATGHGKMVLVSLDEPLARDAMAGLDDRIGIAAVNDPHSVVLSGDVETLDSLVEKLTQNGVQTRPLRANYAFHSPHMEVLLPEFARALGDPKSKPGTIPMFSTVTGKPLTTEQLDTTYWAQNIRQTVRFADAISSASSDVPRMFVEVGPHPVLAISLEQTLAARNTESKVITTLRRERDERKQALLALGALHAHGCRIDWKRLYPDGGRVVSLPTYPWQRERYWIDTILQGGGAATNGGPTLRAELLTAPPEQRLTMLVSFLTGELGHVLRVESSKIPVDASMFHLGLDSLLRLELRNRIAAKLGFELSMVAMSRHDHVAGLAEYLLEQVLPMESMHDITLLSAATDAAPADVENYTF